MGRFRKQLEKAAVQNCTAVHLFIESKGGKLAQAMEIHRYLRSLPLDISTYNHSNVSSAGVTIFSAGKRRFAYKMATFMMHHPIAFYPADIPQPNAEEQFRDERRDFNTMLALLGEQGIKFTDEQMDMMKVYELNLNAQEALDSGLIHEIQEFAKVSSFIVNEI
jgi:ATP-dependent protease ClpP protease subunit